MVGARRSPLRRRLWRELRSEWSKYLAVFLLMVSTIGFVSGFLVADNSMLAAYEEGFVKYNIEDGNFTLSRQANRAQRKAIEAAGVTLYENFYLDQPLSNGSKMRLFQNRTQVNLVCVMQGRLPQAPGEIAIDRMYADNNALTVGDTLQTADGSTDWVITGLVALSDYSCLFENNSDTMFDSIKFGVGILCAQEFEGLDAELVTRCYAWKYDEAPVDEAEENERAEELMKVINAEAALKGFIPRYSNQAIQFTGDDMGSDRAMIVTLLYIVIVIMAFVFGITTRGTIVREAGVIGTLRASGYTKSELTRHYMAMPLLVTLIGALIGNILGYTVLKDVCAGMYYGSYSLPTYVTLWNAEAFWMTTAVPVALMAVITDVTLRRALELSPLQFLRRDLSRRRQKRALPLHPRIPFFSRFGLRVILQNLGSYAVLFVGILFANLLLMFGILLPAVLEHYQSTMENGLIAQYQYILQIPMEAMDETHRLKSMLALLKFSMDAETENEDAERFSAYSLETLPEPYKSEEVLLYGVEPDSRYLPLDLSDGAVYISSAYADKYLLAAGDTITLREEYEADEYTFTVTGVYDYIGGLAVFMSREALNAAFALDEDYFSGYFSDSEIADIDAVNIATIIDLESLTKISRQLDVSMGNMMGMVDGFAVLIFVVVIYLLSKMMIERSAQSISMAKILGYSNAEIARLYILPTAVVTVAFLALSLPLETQIMKTLFRVMMLEMVTGWIPLYIDPMVYVQMMLIGTAAYAVVAVFEYRRVRRVPMDEALKNVE